MPTKGGGWAVHGGTVEARGIHYNCLLCGAGDLPQYQWGTKYEYNSEGKVIGSKDVEEAQCQNCGAWQWLSVKRKTPSTYCRGSEAYYETMQDEAKLDYHDWVEDFFEDEWNKRM